MNPGMLSPRPWTARPTISLICPTGHPGPLVASVLAPLRSVVDEIIVAADSRAGESELGHYATVADVLLRYEFIGSNRHWPWLADQARGDWLFLLDGDEIPSAALVESLRDLVQDRRVHQYVLPIHWPWPDAAHRLAAEPWASDQRLRLLRNDGRLTFAARKHAIANPNPPIRLLDELPVYHLDLLLPDRERRQEKARRYDRQLFGLLTGAGLPFNEAFYLPEARNGECATTAVPAEDANAIANALSARRDPDLSLDPETVALHERETIALYSIGADLPAEAYRAKLELARPLPAFAAERSDHPVWIYVTNEGTIRWPYGDSQEPQIRLGFYWQRPDGGDRFEAGRAFLPHALNPGERTLIQTSVCGPLWSGPARLVLDVVHERVRWFECSISALVDAGPSASERIAALGRQHGGLVPLSVLMQNRREIAGVDGLRRHYAPGASSPRRRWVAKLTRDLEGEWAASADTIDRLVEVGLSKRPKVIVEFGSGTSTIVLAGLLARIHRRDGKLISFEQDGDWVASTRECLEEHDLDRVASVIQLPLGVTSPEMPIGFIPTEESDRLLRAHPPEMIFVDAPSLVSGASRLGNVDLVAPFVKRDAVLLLDDAFRDAELCIAAAWSERPDVTVHGVRCTSRGLLEATLHPPADR